MATRIETAAGSDTDILLSIIMPCYNRAFDLEKVLTQYDQQAGDAPFELIAVDDASTDRTYEILSGYRPSRYRLVARRQAVNGGPARARNTGIGLANGRYIAFVGDDILPATDFVHGHVRAHQTFPRREVAILGQIRWGPDLPVNRLMDYIDGEGAQQFSYRYLRDGRTYDFRHLYTANISLKKELLLELSHGFDSDFPYPAFEDAELGYRLAQHGMRILYCAGIEAYHYHYHTTWSFTRRQTLCGLSSRILVQKHPELASHPSFRGHFRRLMVMLRPGHLVRGLRHAAQAGTWDQAAYHFASFYEWSQTPGLAKLYGPLLDYAYYNGVINHVLGEEAFRRWAHAAHANAYLLPAIRQFGRFAKEHREPFPSWMPTIAP